MNHQQLLNHNRSDVDAYAKLAAIYATMGEDNEAIVTAYKIVDINIAAAAQVERFVADVKAGKFREQENK